LLPAVFLDYRLDAMGRPDHTPPQGGYDVPRYPCFAKFTLSELRRFFASPWTVRSRASLRMTGEGLSMIALNSDLQSIDG
jgi:hypothetical protein